MKRRGETVFLGLGTNLGGRRGNLARAMREIGKHPRMRILARSRVYETSPVGPDQPAFLNGALKIETDLKPGPLLSALKKMEKKMGRRKTFAWGPRRIDLDILFYGDRKIKSARLRVPHPLFHKRKFVLKPLCDLCPGFKPPGFRKSVRALARALTDRTQKVKLLPRNTDDKRPENP